MAQRVITLAKEETSQEILTQINGIQTVVDDVKSQTKFGGG